MLTRRNSNLFLLLFLLFIPATNWAGTFGNTDPPPPPVKGNWVNQMSPSGCIVPNADNQLEISVTVNVGKNDLHNYPSIHLQYDFEGLVVGVSPAIQAFDLIEYLVNDIQVYRTEFLFTIDLPLLCSGGSNIVDFHYNLALVTQGSSGTDIYPVRQQASSNGLFPMDLFWPDLNDVNLIPDPIVSGIKSICCEGMIQHSSIESDKENTVEREQNNELENQSLFAFESVPFQNSNAVAISKNNIQVGPNPFTSGFSIFVSETNGDNLVAKLFSVDGQLKGVQEYKINSGEFHYQSNPNLPVGIYLLQVELNGIRKSFKLIKQE